MDLDAMELKLIPADRPAEVQCVDRRATVGEIAARLTDGATASARSRNGPCRLNQNGRTAGTLEVMES